MKPIADVLKALNTTDKGISENEAKQRIEKYGPNQLSKQKGNTVFTQIRQAFLTPFNVVLAFLAIISYMLDYHLASAEDKDLTGTIIMIVMILASGIVTLIQSVKSNKAAEKLESMIKVTTNVIRGGSSSEIELERVVIGDIVALSAGDIIPADLRIIRARDLFVAQSTLSGESYPVEKRTISPKHDEMHSVTDLPSIALMGTNVVSGSATGVVIATGRDTQFGKISDTLAGRSPKKTSFDIGISKTSWLLIRFMAIMAPTVCVLNGMTKGDWIAALTFGLSTAVGLTPEMLPVIVSTNLVRGALKMSRQGTIVKDINSIQNFGAMDVLCTDKTGTLTQDKVILEYHYDVNGKENEKVLRHAYLNSYYQTGLKNLMDKAIITAAKKELNIVSSQFSKVDEIPFDFHRRRMSTVIQYLDGTIEMITKGAVEEMLAISSQLTVDNENIPLSNSWKEKIRQQVEDLNGDGFRVLGLAYKENPIPKNGDELAVDDESEMIFLGVLAFLDPPKTTASNAVANLKKSGVSIKILTGDNELVTKSVCNNIGFHINGKVVSGIDIDTKDDSVLSKLVEEHNVFVKLSPDQKEFIVKVLRKNNHVVGFLGDGINDAPAMKASDVGVSVDTAVDIAKESSGIILLKKDLSILYTGIRIGRETFGNIMKYIKATCSSNFGNVFSILVASAFLPFLPMQPLQLLFLNLVYDLSCLSIPLDTMDKDYLDTPKKWESQTIGRFMVWLGPTSSIFDITTYALLYWYICPSFIGHMYPELSEGSKLLFIQLFNAGWFVESLWTQTFVLHALRTEKVPFIQSMASGPMTMITMIAVAFGSIVPFTGFGKSLGLLPLPINFWFVLGATMFLYIALVTLIKTLYIKKFKTLL
ncbi:magnesium-translocating P-type ATPase [Lactiplantibacillus plantarum]|uniref:magnesium-translocating P-type ATPase n=1 Tax=Lactiplantibacillus plantarum TaxID=1590 RepID=UPI003C6CED75